MHDAVLRGGADVAPGDLVFVDEHGRVIWAAVGRRIVCDRVDIAAERLAAVLREIVALRDLKLVIFGKGS